MNRIRHHLTGVLLLMLAMGSLPAGATLMAPTLKEKIRRHLEENPYLLLQQGEIPALPRGGMFSKGITLEVRQGRWEQTTTLGMKRATDTYLPALEILELKGLRVSDSSITLKLCTFEQFPIGQEKPPRYEHLWVRMRFELEPSLVQSDTKSHLEAILANLSTLVHPYRSPRQAHKAAAQGGLVRSTARVEIQLGMGLHEVEDLLGPPLERRQEAGKLIYRYADVTITFLKGKVVGVVL